MCSKLALHVERRWQEPWRYLTYALVHVHVWHMLKNIAGLLMAGMILEYYHSSWRVCLVYIAGVIVGASLLSLCTHATRASLVVSEVR